MQELRALWVALAGVLVVVGVTILNRPRQPGGWFPFFLSWALIAVGFCIFVAAILSLRFPGASRATKMDLSITNVRTWGEMREGSMPTEDEFRLGRQGLIEVIVKCRAALPADAHAVELSFARARIRLDRDHVEDCKGLVSHWVDRAGDIPLFPKGFSNPPRIPAGSSIEIRCGFYVRAFRPAHGSGWIQPHDCRIERFEVVDLLNHRHSSKSLKGVEFDVSWVPANHPHSG